MSSNMSEYPGDPAFPYSNPWSGFSKQGLTIRDYFACQVLSGCFKLHAAVGGNFNDETVAKRAYEVADAMLKARKT